MTISARPVAIAALLLSAGCGVSTLPQRYPSWPPAGMAAAQVEQDENACLTVARNATVERAWAYIGCMVSKGHTVGVAFHVGGQPAYLGVTQTRPHEGAAIATELDACRKSAYAAGRAAGGSRDAMVDRMESTFRTCLDPRGYVVQRQEPPAPRRAVR